MGVLCCASQSKINHNFMQFHICCFAHVCYFVFRIFSVQILALTQILCAKVRAIDHCNRYLWPNILLQIKHVLIFSMFVKVYERAIEMYTVQYTRCVLCCVVLFSAYIFLFEYELNRFSWETLNEIVIGCFIHVVVFFVVFALACLPLPRVQFGLVLWILSLALNGWGRQRLLKQIDFGKTLKCVTVIRNRIWR